MSERQTGEPLDLLGYISSQVETAEQGNITVNDEAADDTGATGTEGSSENASQVAPEPANDAGVTNQQSEPEDSEKILLQQRINDAERRQQQMAGVLALLAKEAKAREDKLFNEKLELLSPEEQEAEKERARVARIEAENTYLRTIRENQERQQSQVQEQIDKTAVAHRLMQRLELPATDQVVMTALMESGSFPEMVATAQRLSRVYRATDTTAAKAAAQQAAASGVHAASGETAPAREVSRAPQRQGDLISMMQERSYTSESAS